MRLCPRARALERFERMVAAQGGPHDFVERLADRLPAAPVVRDGARQAPRACCRRSTARALGFAVVRLGGGRLREGGGHQPVGGPFGGPAPRRAGDAGQRLACIHADSEAAADAAEAAMRPAFVIGPGPWENAPLIHQRIGG